MTTKKKLSSKTVVLEARVQPKAGVLASEHEERIDIERTDIYPSDMIQRHRDRVERRERTGPTLAAPTEPMRRLTRADLDDTTDQTPSGEQP